MIVLTHSSDLGEDDTQDLAPLIGAFRRGHPYPVEVNVTDQLPPEGAPAGPLPDATGDEGPANVVAASGGSATESIQDAALPMAYPTNPVDMLGTSAKPPSHPYPDPANPADILVANNQRTSTAGTANADPPTKGIPMAEKKPGQRALHTLQNTPNGLPGAALGRRMDDDTYERVAEAAWEVSVYHPPVGDQASRHGNLSAALSNFLTAIVVNVPPGPERSTAISRAREAKMWASAGVALEPRP